MTSLKQECIKNYKNEQRIGKTIEKKIFKSHYIIHKNLRTNAGYEIE